MVFMPDVQAMQFYGDSFKTSYGFAQQFAGEEGHIATLPEIISARAATDFDTHPIWYNYYTTATSEYFGLSRSGVPIVIVTHGNGPLNSIEAIQKAYKPRNLAGRHSTNGSGHITLKEFRRLEDGEYGEVSIIDFRRTAQVYSDEWFDFVTMAQAERDPLLQARLGPDWYLVLEKLRQATIQATVQRQFTRTRHNGNTIKSDGPLAYWRHYSWPESLAGRSPYAHLLAVSRDYNNIGAEESVSFDVSCHERDSGKRFVGIRKDGNLTGTHPGPSLLDFYKETLVVPNTRNSGHLATFFQVRQIGDNWFTCVRKEGYGLDSAWPEYPVTDLELVGSPGRIFSANEMFFFRYDMAEVQWQAPKSANAYYCGKPRSAKSGGRDGIEADIYYCRITPDTSQRCVSKAELNGSFDQQMTLLERLERTRSQM